LLGADDGDDALMGGGAGDVGEGLARLRADADFEGVGKRDDGFKAVVAAFAGYQHVVEAAFAGFKGFFDGMEAVEGLHRFSLEEVGKVSVAGGQLSQI
jgi:hypothetical protein